MLIVLSPDSAGIRWQVKATCQARRQQRRTRCHSRETQVPVEKTANFHGMTQLRSVFAVSEVKNA
jgi:hypothetical protein